MTTADTAIILAGGRSLRMGFDKQLLRLNDEYLLGKNLALIAELFSQIIIVSNDPDELKNIPNISKARVVSDIFQGKGPLAGIHAGLKESASQFAFVLAVDMPVLDKDYIQKMKKLILESSEGDGLINVNPSGEPEPFFAFYGKHLITDLESALQSKQRSLRRFIDNHQFTRLNYTGEENPKRDIFLNINDKKEFRRFHEMTDPALEDLSRISGEDEALSLQNIPIIRYKGTAHSVLEDEVITEAEIALNLNGEFYQTMYCTPRELKELIVGNLYAQGRIQSPDELLDLVIRRRPVDGDIVFDIDATVRPSRPESMSKREPAELTTSGPQRPALPFLGSLVKKDIDLELDPLKIMDLSAVFQDASALFARTGGNHACALIENGKITLFIEDIGRHNALDKLIGKALLEGKDLTSSMILLSGRMASEMTLKVLRTPVSALLSRAAPTTRSIKLAEENNLTMIGFIRGQRLNIYHLNGGHRLKDYPESE